MPVAGAGRLATLLDLEMFAANGVLVHPEYTPDATMPLRTGKEVAQDLGGRFLLSYLRHRDVRLRVGSGGPALPANPGRVFTTPTPYAPHQVASALALPSPTLARTHVILLDPMAIPFLQGPRRVSCGYGLEYLLPHGYPASALKLPWEKEID